VTQLRIGINTGYRTVGNFGRDERIDCIVIGNEVNLASRPQTHADLGGILLAHEPHALVTDTVLTEITGTITVKGSPNRSRHTELWDCAKTPALRGGSSARRKTACCTPGKLTGQARVEAIKPLQDTLGRLAE
jgi:class 3 adenylate cyclase